MGAAARAVDGAPTAVNGDGGSAVDAGPVVAAPAVSELAASVATVEDVAASSSSNVVAPMSEPIDVVGVSFCAKLILYSLLRS